MRPAALTIAGFDPSGGAGLQADLRVFNALGLAGWSVATAITIQNTQGVHGVHLVDAETLHKQLDAVFSDARSLGAVKIGMLGGAAQARAVADALRRWKPRNVVLDPVLASTAGVPLLDDPEALDELIPLCDLVTPNAHEHVQARTLLVKGGHAAGDPDDKLYVDGTLVRTYHGTRIATPHTHGTGCALSAGIAAYLALGVPLQEAIAQAKEIVAAGLRNPVIIGEGRGYPDVRAIRGIYVLTDARRDATETIRAALNGGARIVQLREKSLPTPDLINLAKRLRDLAHEHGALFIVNDRVDVALAADADGVHLGPDDMHPRDARALLGQRIIGASVSTVEEAAALAPFTTYFGVGAIYGSATKLDA
ncbi:MAG TPA: bifunctional hydroxymethylpyrimidine kinase/phosphomethylpyrimidine kinase, partial [Thermoanaerobaculia bacterium]|nr:bifunctional hydroxymethylpyrimidine kinase/phosphomethylpyrimidine kinase [Thermoanaerobaculia bacterium]